MAIEFYEKTKVDEMFLSKPSGGNVGQVLTKSSDGATWSDNVKLETSFPATSPVEEDGKGATIKAIWSWVTSLLPSWLTKDTPKPVSTSNQSLSAEEKTTARNNIGLKRAGSEIEDGDVRIVDADAKEVAIGEGAEITGIETGTGGDITRVGNVVTHIFTDTTSSSTFRAPNGAKNFSVVVVGGGGGGGRGLYYSNFEQSGGGGGGGGVYVVNKTANLTAGGNYTITVGAGGSGAEYGSAAGNGGASSIESDISTIIAEGGYGGGNGIATRSGSGGANGSVSVDGEIVSQSIAGTTGKGTKGLAGGNGSGAKSSSLGESNVDGIAVDVQGYVVGKLCGAAGSGGVWSNYETEQIGGESGGGHGGWNRSGYSKKGGNGTEYGAGGGGGCGGSSSTSINVGGNGHNGVVVITYDVSDIAKAGVAIGYNAKSNAVHAIQLGEGTNSTAWSLQFHSVTVVKDSKIPTSSLEDDVVTNDNLAQNLKTINNESIVGSGNISVTGEPEEYLKEASLSEDGQTLTLTPKDGNQISFNASYQIKDMTSDPEKRAVNRVIKLITLTTTDVKTISLPELSSASDTVKDFALVIRNDTLGTRYIQLGELNSSYRVLVPSDYSSLAPILRFLCEEISILTFTRLPWDSDLPVYYISKRELVKGTDWEE